MLDIVRSSERFHLQNDWLSAYWHFSFDHYHDPSNMNWGPLRVFNNDTIQPSRGFPMHPHRDMEILTYVISGALEHKDNTGGHGVIHPGEVQRMSAGTGIVHSEFNASATDPCELVQIWVLPAEKGVTPSYDQKQFSVEERSGTLLPIASGNGIPGTLRIGQDVTFYVSHLRPEDKITHDLKPERLGYLFALGGRAEVNGESIEKGDSVKIARTSRIELQTSGEADLLFIDLPCDGLLGRFSHHVAKRSA